MSSVIHPEYCALFSLGFVECFIDYTILTSDNQLSSLHYVDRIKEYFSYFSLYNFTHKKLWSPLFSADDECSL